jgi:hypothetical protein
MYIDVAIVFQKCALQHGHSVSLWQHLVLQNGAYQINVFMLAHVEKKLLQNIL